MRVVRNQLSDIKIKLGCLKKIGCKDDASDEMRLLQNTNLQNSWIKNETKLNLRMVIHRKGHYRKELLAVL